MAKLPSISYQASPGVPRGISPQAAVQDANNRQNIVGAALGAASNFAEAYSTRKGQDQAIEASANYQQLMLDYQEFAASNPTATAGQLSDWATNNGYDPDMFGGIDTDEFDRQREAIGETSEELPAHLWYAEGLERVMEEARAKNEDLITVPRYQREWSNASRANAQEIVGKARLTAADMEQAYNYQRIKAEVELSITNGSLERARGLLDNSAFDANPIEKKLLKRKVFVTGKQYEVRGDMMSADSPDDYEKLVTKIMDPVWADGLNADEQLKLLSSTVTQRNAMEKAIQDQKTAAEDRLSIAALISMSRGEMDVESLNSLAGQMSYDRFAAMHSKLRTMNESSVSNDSYINGIQRDILDLKYGMQEGDFDEKIIELQRRLLDGLGTEFDAKTMRTLDTSLQGAIDEPYSNPEFKHVRSQISNLILGGEGEKFSFMATTSQRQNLAAAEQSLFEFIKKNGGMRADVSEWQANEMPRFLEDSAKADLLNIDDSISDKVVFTTSGDFAVDIKATTSAMADEIRMLSNSDSPSDRQKLTRAKERAVMFGQWNEQYGDRYGVN